MTNINTQNLNQKKRACDKQTLFCVLNRREMVPIRTLRKRLFDISLAGRFEVLTKLIAAKLQSTCIILMPDTYILQAFNARNCKINGPYKGKLQ